MNIFALEDCPYESAKSLCDNHKNKMNIETCQILSCVIDTRSIHSSAELGLPQYPKAHAKHPCTIWAMESRENAEWLVKHLHGIEQELTRCYPRTNFKLMDKSKEYAKLLSFCEFPQEKLTPFAQAMPDMYKVPGDHISAYRLYYLMDKTFARYARTPMPEWFAIGREKMFYQAKEHLHVA